LKNVGRWKVLFKSKTVKGKVQGIGDRGKCKVQSAKCKMKRTGFLALPEMTGRVEMTG
jgi:hypothetical protein